MQSEKAKVLVYIIHGTSVWVKYEATKVHCVSSSLLYFAGEADVLQSKLSRHYTKPKLSLTARHYHNLMASNLENKGTMRYRMGRSLAFTQTGLQHKHRSRTSGTPDIRSSTQRQKQKLLSRRARATLALIQHRHSVQKRRSDG